MDLRVLYLKLPDVALTFVVVINIARPPKRSSQEKAKAHYAKIGFALEIKSEEDEENSIERTITDETKVIAGLKAKKVITSIKSSERTVLFEEWFTTDTLLIKFALDKEQELIESYGGTKTNMPRSFSESMLSQSGQAYDSVEGRLLKYSMQMNNEDNKGFKMELVLKKI